METARMTVGLVLSSVLVVGRFAGSVPMSAYRTPPAPPVTHTLRPSVVYAPRGWLPDARWGSPPDVSIGPWPVRNPTTRGRAGPVVRDTEELPPVVVPYPVSASVCPLLARLSSPS